MYVIGEGGENGKTEAFPLRRVEQSVPLSWVPVCAKMIYTVCTRWFSPVAEKLKTT